MEKGLRKTADMVSNLVILVILLVNVRPNEGARLNDSQGRYLKLLANIGQNQKIEPTVIVIRLNCDKLLLICSEESHSTTILYMFDNHCFSKHLLSHLRTCYTPIFSVYV